MRMRGIIRERHRERKRGKIKGNELEMETNCYIII